MRIASATLALCVLLAPALPSCAAQEARKSFRVHYVGGPADFTGEHVELTVTPQALLMEGKAGKKKKSVAIPLDGIVVVVHGPVRFNRMQQVGPYLPNGGPPSSTVSGPDSAGLGAASEVLVFAAWGTYQVARLMTLGIAGSSHGQKHFVTILWQKDGVEREWVVEAGKDDYRPLLQQLEQFSGKKCVDLQARYDRFKDALKKEKEKAISVTLDRQVQVGTVTLPPGLYRLVLLEDNGGLGELYFFAGKDINEANLKGVAVVEMEPGAAGPAEVVYSSQVPYRIIEVHSPARVFRLKQT